jgi:hypothetical protein
LSPDAELVTDLSDQSEMIGGLGVGQ